MSTIIRENRVTSGAAIGPDAGEAWDQFCEGLKQAGRDVMAASQEANEQAEGILQLAQLVGGHGSPRCRYSECEFPIGPSAYLRARRTDEAC